MPNYSLYQILLKYTGQTALARDAWTNETIFLRIFFYMSEISRQWPLSLHSKNSKIAKYGSYFTNFDNIAIITVLLLYFINIVPADIFCFISFFVK